MGGRREGSTGSGGRERRGLRKTRAVVETLPWGIGEAIANIAERGFCSCRGVMVGAYE